MHSLKRFSYTWNVLYQGPGVEPDLAIIVVRLGGSAQLTLEYMLVENNAVMYSVFFTFQSLEELEALRCLSWITNRYSRTTNGYCNSQIGHCILDCQNVLER